MLQMIPLQETVAYVSRVSGILSLSLWLFAQLPQIIENHLNQSVDGVSLAFLVCWISGDTANLIGCILTNALPFQTSLATYYCFVDCILSLQYWYYTRVYPKQKVHHNLLQSPNMVKTPRNRARLAKSLSRRNRFEEARDRPIDIARGRAKSRVPFMKRVLSGTIIGSLTGMAQGAPLHAFASSPSHSVSLEQVGQISAWVCTFCYLCSRSPQILKNFRSGSTKGISVFLFIFAMLGNVFYTVSIVSDLYLIYGQDNFNKVLSDQLPFIVGSCGTVLFDSVIIFQCWYYSRPSASPVEPELHFEPPAWYQPYQKSWDEGNSLIDTAVDYNYGTTTSTKFGGYETTPPPPHYISASVSSSHVPASDFSTPFQVLASSLKRESPRVGPSSPLPTSLIPSIIGTYSAMNKKLMNGQKVPFSPIDFLNDDYHVPAQNSYGTYGSDIS